jgi:hypothetical protein
MSSDRLGELVEVIQVISQVLPHPLRLDHGIFVHEEIAEPRHAGHCVSELARQHCVLGQLRTELAIFVPIVPALRRKDVRGNVQDVLDR